MNIIDIAAVSIIALFAAIGFKRGLAAAVFKLFSFFASLLMAYLLYPIVAKTLKAMSVHEYFKGIVADTLKLDTMFATITQEISDALSALAIPDFLKQAILGGNTVENYDLFGVSSPADYISSFIANIMINALSILIVFILVCVILEIVQRALSIITNLPVISSFDKSGGMAVGIVEGIVFTWLLFSVFSVLLSMNGEFGAEFSTLLDASLTAAFFAGEGNMILQSLINSI